MFVISIKRLFDYSGNRLEKTAEEAKKVYMENLHILTCGWKNYDRDSIRICEIKFKPAGKLPWKEV